MGFYEDIAGTYDEMTRFKDRLESQNRVMDGLLERYPFRSALDAACGTGVYAIALAMKGIPTAGADICDAMLEQARQNAKDAGVAPAWVRASMTQLSGAFEKPFGAVLCLGNSLPHLLTGKELDDTCAGFHELLEPGGVLVVELLNYYRVLARKERIVGVHRSGEREFVRFYDFDRPLIRFNLLTIDWKAGKAVHTLASTPLCPWSADALECALRSAQFENVALFGDMRFSPFDREESPNLVIAATRAAAEQAK